MCPFVPAFSDDKELSPELLSQLTDAVDEANPDDIFSRESLLMRNSSSTSTLPRQKKTSSLRRSTKPGDMRSPAVQSIVGDPGIASPTHVSIVVAVLIVLLINANSVVASTSP